MRVRWLFLAIALLFFTPATAGVTVFKIKSAANWAFIDADGISAPVSLDADKDGIRCRYERGRETQFRYTLPLKGFQQLEVEVKSERAMTLELLLTDEGGTRYRYEAPLEAGDWAHITVKPADLARVGSSAAPGEPLDPAEVVNEMLLAESATPAGETGDRGGNAPLSNTLTIRKVRVETPDEIENF